MASGEFIDRRQYTRALFDREIEVCLLSDENSTTNLSVISCRGKDVSGGGISFYGEMQYENASLLRINIPLCTISAPVPVETKELLKVLAKVMWCKKNGDGANYVIGVQFLNIYEQEFQILHEYVHKLLIFLRCPEVD